MEVFIYTSSSTQIALPPLCQHISIWNKRVSCFCSANLFHVLFGNIFLLTFKFPISAGKKWKWFVFELSFPVSCWNCLLSYLTGITELQIPFLLTTPTQCFTSILSIHSSVSLVFLYHSASPFLIFLLTVDDVPPYFKMEPPQTQVHLEGNRLVLTCMAEGSWPLEFKWIYNGTELTRFSLEYRWGMQPCRQELILLLFLLFLLSTVIISQQENILTAFDCN